MKSSNRNIVMATAILAAVITIFIGTSVGSTWVSLRNVCAIICSKIFGAQIMSGIMEKDISIIWVIRFPRVILAFLIGAVISVSGAVAQSVLKNPLASPYTLGVSSGASLGVGIFVILKMSIPFLGNLALPLIGFLCAMLTMIIVISFSNRVDRGMSDTTVILTGMVFSLFTNAILTILSATHSDDIKTITMWQMGSFSMKGWSYIIAGIPFFVIGLLIILRYNKEMDMLTFGEEQAKSAGVDTVKVKKKLFIALSILSGAAVSLSGTIGFIDLIIPHLVRKIFGPSHRVVIPMCMVFGGILMVVTDLISRTIIAPSELPIGAITAIIGAPFFAYLYFNRRSR